jgi:hypothetical protein
VLNYFTYNKLKRFSVKKKGENNVTENHVKTEAPWVITLL